MARILIVEDDKSINNLIRRNLELVGHECVSVFDGEAVFDALEAQAIDLVLLDIMLPKQDGFTVLSELRNEIPVVFLTARSAVGDRVKGLRLGADDYIVKPFDMTELVEVPDSGFQSPKLNVVWNDNEGNAMNQPKSGAMPYEEAAQIGAEYIYDMFGESMEGEAVEMLYIAPAFSSKPYWQGTTANYYFSIDAMTGERISIYLRSDLPAAENLGEGKTYSLSPVQLEAMQYEAPENASEYAAVARAFAAKHFHQTQVAGAEFVRISLSHGDRAAAIEHAKAYQDAYEADKNKPFNFTLYDAGKEITFNVTDDTGRAALVSVDMDTKQAVNLDTSGSDFIPGYSFEGECGEG